MSKKSRSKLWFLVHSWLTLPIWFFVLIVCVTGTLAVVSQEIVWLATPEARATQPDDDAPLLTYEQVLTAIKKAAHQPLQKKFYCLPMKSKTVGVKVKSLVKMRLKESFSWI